MSNIVFFGGYAATLRDVIAWRSSVLTQLPDQLPDDIHTYAWPHGASASNPLSVFKGSPEIASMINKWKDETYVIGHSSGCAIANEVASLVTRPVNLICLDGFVPYHHQRDLPTTQIWSAMHDGKPSLNYDSLKGNKRFHVYDPPGCTTKWALHFSLVNANANDKYVTDIPSGYWQCKANLCWMNKT